MNVNQRIKMLRERDRYTIKEISTKLGVSIATAQRYESDNGIKAIPYEIIEKYAKIFNVSPSYIMGWEPNSDPKRIPFVDLYCIPTPKNKFNPLKDLKEMDDKNTIMMKKLIHRIDALPTEKKLIVICAITALLDYTDD